jgi:hypothetical protein
MVAAEAFDVVIQVITNDEDDIEFLCGANEIGMRRKGDA